MARKRKTLPKDFGDLLKAGDLAALRAVFDRCELDARGGYGKGTALSFADCPDELARWLVGEGLEVDAVNLTAERTPLHDRASYWPSIAVLIELGAGVDARDKSGTTVLHTAVTKPHHVALLLAAGAEVDPVDGQGSTPLRSGLVRCSNIEIAAIAESVTLLLAAGAAVPEDVDALVTRIGTDFEFHRSNFNNDLVTATAAGLQRLYELFDVAPVPSRVTHDGRSRIEVTATDVDGQYAELWALLVPSSGPAGIVQGEVLRIAGKLAREIGGNGSVNWSDDFRAMTDALGAHLASGRAVTNLDELAPILRRIRTGHAEDPDLGSMQDAAVAWILANPDPTPLAAPSYRH